MVPPGILGKLHLGELLWFLSVSVLFFFVFLKGGGGFVFLFLGGRQILVQSDGTGGESWKMRVRVQTWNSSKGIFRTDGWMMNG